jgi:amino acid adenylation domain-containing protein
MTSSSANSPATMAAVKTVFHFPASYAQQRLWFIDQMSPGGAAYNMPVAVRIEGPLNVDALRRSFWEIARRHESLRTTFSMINGELQQMIAEEIPLELPLEDLRIPSSENWEAQARLHVQKEAWQPFDLAQGPLIRVRLLRLHEQDHLLVVTMHHIISDGWSFGILIRELSALYDAFSTGRPSPLPELAIQYADYSAWQHEWLRGEVLEQQVNYWKQQLAGVEPLYLPVDHPRPAVMSYRGAGEALSIPTEITGKLRKLGQGQDATLYMTLLAAFQVLLFRYSGQHDIAVGSPVAGRQRPEMEPLIGFFINTLVLRTRISGELNFTQLLKQVRETTLQAYAHQDVPFEKLVEVLQPERDLGRTPLFQVMFTLQNTPPSGLQLGAARLTQFSFTGNTAKFDLTLNLGETNSGLQGSLGYSTDLFEDATIQRMIVHFQLLLSSVVAEPERRLSELSLLSQEEQQQLLVEWTRTETVLSRDCVHERFAMQAGRTPAAPALSYAGKSLSYAELNVRANQLARYLRRQGVGRESRVAICMERSLEMVIALLGVLKAGAAYVPMDPDYPSERLSYMLADSQAGLLLTQAALRERLGGHAYGGRLLEWESEQAEMEKESGENLAVAMDPDNLAYVIYTSASTGRAKGVMVSHGNVVRLLECTQERFGFNERDVVTLFHSYAFDFSVWELWSALHYGGKLVVVPYWVSRSPEDFLKLLLEEGVTVLNQTPSAFYQLIAAEESREAARSLAEDSAGESGLQLRVIVFGGEALKYEELQGWLQRHSEKPRLINMYGITETTVHVTYRPITLQDVEAAKGRSGIGRAIADLKLYVLDEWMQPVAVGVKGELYVGGAGVARGYLNRAELTAERFVPNPYAGEAGERLYRSGDQVSWRGDGGLDYHGRLDQQVKVRGFRIELGEIESALGEQTGVKQAVVVMGEEEGEKRLVAYVVAEGGRKLEEIREGLRRRVPEYMVPGVWVQLEQLPLTAHGKLDLKSLPAPERGPQAGYVAPRNEQEERLARIWGTVLRLERVGVEDNFFDLGGHSLLATQVVGRIRDVFQTEISLRQVFEHPTIAGLAAIISHSSPESFLQQVSTVPAAATTPSQDNDGQAAVDKRFFSFPASFAQQRLWFIDQLEPNLPTYNVSGAARIRASLDAGILKKSFQEIVDRHETLRTTFMAEGGEPQQVIWEKSEVELPLSDLRSLPPEQREAEARRQVEEDVRRPFDLVRGPLLRLRLFQLDEQDHVVLMNVHHIVSDAWSLGVLMRELSALYTAFSAGKSSPLPSLPIQYVDYTAWQREWLQGEVLEKQIRYWQRQLAGVSLLELLTDRPRPAVLTYRGKTQAVTISSILVDKLKELGRQQGATLYMTVLAAFQALLYRYSGQPDIAVGSPIAGRRRPEMELLIGFFVNTLVLRADISGNMSFVQLLQQVRETTLEAYAHQDVPFERLVEILQPGRDLSRSPLFQVMFVLQNVPPAALELGSAKLVSFPFGTGTAKFDLTFILTENNSELQGGLSYSTDLFDDDTVERMIEHFKKLLGGIVAEPHRRLAAIPLLTREEEKQVVEQWNHTGKLYPQERWVHEMFAEQAIKSPHEVALTYGSRQWTYAELDQRSNQLAHYLIAQDVGPDERVGICMQRGPEMIVGLLGVVKAGGAYIPLDPAYPRARLEYMLENSAMRMLLTESGFSELLPHNATKKLLLDTAWPEISNCSRQSPRVQLSGENIAYVIYTSGSTGKPKGVALPHRALSNLIQWQMESFVFSLKNTLQFTSMSFDVSVQEIFSTLASGGVLHLIDDDMRKDISQLKHLMNDRRIERIFLPFVALDYLCKTYLEEDAPECTLREVITGGEQLQITPAIMQLFQRLRGAVLVNHYGPSETHVCNSYTLRGDSSQWPKLPAIGKPITNAQLYVLNEWMELTPLGVPGELFIAGAGMARGYLNNPDLTAERFVPNPFSHTAGDRLYKTGDIVRWRKDGELEFLGRIDGQVKIRGYRIELGEIETVLRQHPAVEQAVVIVREDELKQKQLIAYLVLRHQIAAPELREELQSRLPEYMVPSVFMVLEKIPLTPSGKTDRRALPLPQADQSPSKQSAIAPRTPTEELLAQIWTAVLGRTQISVDDDFFALGGHSLLATQVTARIRNVFKVDLPLRRLFEAPTISKLAKVVDQLTAASVSQKIPPLHPVPKDGPIPLSYAQRRLWFIDQLAPGQMTVYNIPASVRIVGPLNMQALQQALNEILRRHESLRTRFAVSEGEPRQIIAPPSNLEFPFLDLSSVPEEQREDEARKIALVEAQTPFDLELGPLFRVKMLRLSNDEHVLITNMHHIISDAWSIGVLMREASVLYQAFSTGRSSPLPELAIQYADYSAWQHEWLRGEVLEQQVSYWKQQLAGVEPLYLPVDHPRPAVMSYRGAGEALSIPAEITMNLKKLGQAHGATLYMTLLAAFQVLLSRYSGQRDIAIGSPIAGRRQSELEPLIGFFINTLVLRTRISGELNFTQLLKQVRETTLQAYAHQDVPFEKLVEVLQPERDLGRTPLFQVMFTLQNTPPSGLQLGAARLTQFSFTGNTAKFDLTLNLGETNSGLQGSLGYSTDLFEDATIQRMIVHFQLLLSSVVAEPERRLSELSLLSQEEQQQLLVEWTRTETVLSRDCVHERFAMQAGRTPAAPALSYAGKSLSYAELNVRANQLARYLRRQGVGRESRVAICMERSLEMVIALLGVLKAGAAYVPMDPDYPSERLSYMLADSQAGLLLTQAALRERLGGHAYGGRLLEWESEQAEMEKESGENLAVAMDPDNLAYVIYTSASTGRAKGVMVSHGNVVRLLECTQERFGFNERDVVTLFHSYAFDFSVWELWSALHYGGKLVVVPYWVSRSPEDFLKLLLEEGVTVLNQTPSAFYQLIAAEESREAARSLAEDSAGESGLQLRVIVFGGEALKYEELQGWLQRHSEKPRLINMYGITETTVHVTYRPITLQDVEAAKGRSGIGRAIADLKLYVLDEWMQPVAVGVKGELYVGGAGVARGYLNRAELTAERFVPNPYAGEAGERLYRSGDQVSWRGDGGLDYHGRLDQQVKVRGFRIELGEIESALGEQTGVKQAVVVMGEEEGEKRLVAYVVAEGGRKLEEIREGLRRRVPEYMVPGVWVQLEQLPLTAHGKLDLKSLPAPERGPQAGYVAPRNEQEERLARIWGTVLRLERVGVEDNFFDLGGHSLLAVRLRAMLRNRLNYNLTLVDLFQNPTIAKMAKRLGPAPEHLPQQILVPIQPHGLHSPFFCIHPIGGQVFCYNELSRELGLEQPFYGLQALPSVSAETIEQMASIYIREIRQVQQHGPYFLSGWSMGGLIAFEMARQLKEEGEFVALLALFDTYPPSPNNAINNNGNNRLPVLARFALEMARSLGKDVSALQSQFAQLRAEEQKKLILDELVQAEVLARDNAEVEFTNMLSVYTRNLLAMESYSPAPQDQSIVLFKASESDNPEAVAGDWKPLARQGVELHLIPGNHYTILQRPSVSTLADGLRETLIQHQ